VNVSFAVRDSTRRHLREQPHHARARLRRDVVDQWTFEVRALTRRSLRPRDSFKDPRPWKIEPQQSAVPSAPENEAT
jgi:hypothetical protein